MKKGNVVWKSVWIAEPDCESDQYQIQKRRRLAQMKAIGERRMMEAVDRLGQFGGQMYHVACSYNLLQRRDECLINTDFSHEDDLSMTVTVKICPVLERKPECTASGGHEEKQLWQHLPTNDEEEELSQHLPTTEHICNDGKQLTVGFAQTSTETITQGNPQRGFPGAEQTTERGFLGQCQWSISLSLKGRCGGE